MMAGQLHVSSICLSALFIVLYDSWKLEILIFFSVSNQIYLLGKTTTLFLHCTQHPKYRFHSSWSSLSNEFEFEGQKHEKQWRRTKSNQLYSIFESVVFAKQGEEIFSRRTMTELQNCMCIIYLFAMICTFSFL